MEALGNTSTCQPLLPAETLNRWTHALGFLVSLPAAYILWEACRPSDPIVMLAFGVYCLALVLLYAASALSHSFERHPRRRQFFRTADQVCIYLMIAGTFTPFAAAYLRTPFGIAQLAAMWLMAAFGIALCVRRRGGPVGLPDVALCMAVAWIPVFSMAHFYAVGGAAGFALVAAGGFLYSAGTIFLLNDHRHPYWHGIWHVATLGGTACHYIYLLDYVAIG